MTKTTLAVSLSLALLASPLAFANPITRDLNAVSAGVTGTNFNYSEAVPAVFGPSDAETGIVPGFRVGLSGTYGVPFLGQMYTGLAYNQSGGNIGYRQGNRVRTLDSASFYNVGATVGKPVFLARDIAVLPYVTGGYHQWNRNLQGPGGYNEVYSNEYAGLGVKGFYAVNRRLVLGAHAGFDAVLGGGVSAYLRQTRLDASFQTSGQESLGLSVNYAVRPGWGLYADAGYTHLNYTGGSVFYGGQAIGFEPASQSNIVGVGLGVKAYF